MLNKTSFLIILLAIILQPIFSFASGPKILAIPKKYIDGPDNSILPDSKKDVAPSLFWIVCSDRDNNQTYSDPKSRSPKKVIGYLDKFYVTDESGEFLHLYKWAEDIKGEKNELLPTAEDCGWAYKSKLLLWMRCIINDKHLGKKALPIIKENTLSGDLKAYINEGKGTLKMYTGPDLNPAQVNNNAVRMFQFLFIYKEDGNSVLLGKGYQSGSSHIQDDILGWVSKDIIQVWDTRVCLDPNNDPGGVDERKGANIRASLFHTPQNVLAWKSSGDTSGVIWDKDTYGAPVDPYWKRFPVFSNENGIINTGTTTDIIDKAGDVIVNKMTHAQLENQYSIQRQSIRNVNTVFVIDAGSGFNEYVTAIGLAIQKMASDVANGQSGSDEQNTNKFRYGAVVYRDYQDGSCNGGDKSVDRYPLNTSIGDLINWLSQQAVIKGCKQGNKAVNLGLFEALRMIASQSSPGQRNDAAQVSTDQSNFIVLVGGEMGKVNPKGHTDDEIAQLIANTKTNLLAFQAIHGRGLDYDQFIPRISALEKKSSQMAYSADKAKAQGTMDMGPLPVFREFGTNAYKADYPATSQLQGLITYASIGQPITVDTIVAQITSQLVSNNADVDRKVNALTSWYEGEGEKYIKIDASLMRYVVSLGQELNNQALVAKYKNNNTYQFFVKGFTTENVNKLTSPVFKKVLYVHVGELIELIAQLNTLNFEGSNSDTRQKIKDSYYEILKTYLGDKKAKEAIGSGLITADDVQFYITGIHSSNQVFKHSVNDFTRPDKVSGEEIGKLREYMLGKITGLQSVLTEPSLTVKYDWGIYYWVPEERMP